VSAVTPPATGAPTAAPSSRRIVTPPPAHSPMAHVRATAVLLVLTLLVSGFVYPLVVTGIAQVLDPSAANGSLVSYNGTVVGSSLVAQNTDAPYLFWERPSLSDYNTTLGMITPYGPTDPLLAQWFNETLAYLREYGNFTVNATLPIWLVSPSSSAVDPDLTPEAVLVQVPRVANATNLSFDYLTNFINAHISNPPVPGVGVPYVDVLQLDLDLLPIIGRG
jgi:potassium-transporting ATPase KdpC subunit